MNKLTIQVLDLEKQLKNLSSTSAAKATIKSDDNQDMYYSAIELGTHVFEPFERLEIPYYNFVHNIKDTDHTITVLHAQEFEKTTQMHEKKPTENYFDLRKKELFKLGFHLSSDAMIFQSIRIPLFIIQKMASGCWLDYYEVIKKRIHILKFSVDINDSVDSLRYFLYQTQIIKDRKEQLSGGDSAKWPNEYVIAYKKSDKQKLQDFYKSLGNITGPELSTERSRSHLELTLFAIGQAREYLQEQINDMPDEQAAGN